MDRWIDGQYRYEQHLHGELGFAPATAAGAREAPVGPDKGVAGGRRMVVGASQRAGQVVEGYAPVVVRIELQEDVFHGVVDAGQGGDVFGQAGQLGAGDVPVSVCVEYLQNFSCDFEKLGAGFLDIGIT